MIEGRPSATALHIAKMMIFASKEPGIKDLIPPVTAAMSRKYLCKASPRSAMVVRAFSWSWVRAIIHAAEGLTIPGMTLHYVVRKARLERVSRQCYQEGYRHLVVLGAGFDTLTQRLARDHALEDLSMVEVDHPSTQRIKREVLSEEPRIGSRIQFIPYDIGSAKPHAFIRQCRPEHAGVRTLVIAEGLLMYLEPPVVTNLFKSIRDELGDNVRIAFTFMEPQSKRRIAFKKQSPIVDYWLRLKGENFRWAIPISAANAFLTEHGYRLIELVDHNKFRQLYLNTGVLARQYLADGDHLCVSQSA